MIEKCLEHPALEPITEDLARQRDESGGAKAAHLARCWRAGEIAAGSLDPTPPTFELTK
jgi:hypothetical protein